MSSNSKDDLGAEIEAALEGVDLQSIGGSDLEGPGAPATGRRDPNLRRGTIVGTPCG